MGGKEGGAASLNNHEFGDALADGFSLTWQSGIHRLQRRPSVALV